MTKQKKTKYHDLKTGRPNLWAATRGIQSGTLYTIIRRGVFDKALIKGKRSKGVILDFNKADKIFRSYDGVFGFQIEIKFQKINCKYCGDLFRIRKDVNGLHPRYRTYCSVECFKNDPIKCFSCGEILSPDEFYKRKDSTKGIKSKCKKCDYRRSQNYLKSNPEKTRQYQKKTKLKHKKEIKEKRKKEVANLDDTYVRRTLARYSTLSESEFPQWMIDLKRSELKLQRAMKKKGISTSVKNIT